MPGELNDPYLSPWPEHYEPRYDPTGEWMDDQRRPPMKRKRVDQNRVQRVLRLYADRRNPDARSKSGS